MKIRIAKFLASCGIGSRRKCEDIITAGDVQIDDETVTTPATTVGPENVVKVRGKIVSPNKLVYYLLNKPTGYTSTVADEHAKKLITELVPGEPPVWPVGRLDRDTAGLIVLTNDGELTQKLTHPSFEKQKTYIATVSKPLTDKQIQELLGGIRLDDGPIKPDSVHNLIDSKYEITVHEGRNRLVRRIFEYFGVTVIALTRTKLAFLTLKGLEPGQYRVLTTDEVDRLKNA